MYAPSRPSHPPSFHPQPQLFQQQIPPRRPPPPPNSSTLAMSSSFSTIPYDNSESYMPWPPVNGNMNNMMSVNSGPLFAPRHLASPPPPMNPNFHSQGFPPPPQGPNTFFPSGPVGAFQQPPPNGVLSPLHSPPLGPVGPHMHNSNGNNFGPPNNNMPPLPYIPAPPSALGNRNLSQFQMPPPPNFSGPFVNNSLSASIHGSGSRDNGLGGPYMTPPVSAPSSPSPPPPHQMNGYCPTPPPLVGMQSYSPLIAPNLPTPPHMNYRVVPANLPSPPNLNFGASIPRTGAGLPNGKPPSPKSKLSTSTTLASRSNSSTPVPTTNDRPPSATPKKLNPSASAFMPVVKSPAIVSSTPPPAPKAVNSHTPPTGPKHFFSPLSSHFSNSSSSTPSQEDQSERPKFNPNAPAFVPPPRKPSPPPNAPTGPSATRNSPKYSGLALSPPTGPRNSRSIPPPPNYGIGIGPSIDIESRGLPPTTPQGPRCMTPSKPARSSSIRHSNGNGYTKAPPPKPITAITRIDGVDKPVPTAPAAMLEGLAPAAKIDGVPTAPAAMLEKWINGEESRGRNPAYIVSKLPRMNSRRHYYGSNHGSRDGSKTREEMSPTPTSSIGFVVTAVEERVADEKVKNEDSVNVNEESGRDETIVTDDQFVAALMFDAVMPSMTVVEVIEEEAEVEDLEVATDVVVEEQQEIFEVPIKQEVEVEAAVEIVQEKAEAEPIVEVIHEQFEETIIEPTVSEVVLEIQTPEVKEDEPLETDKIARTIEELPVEPPKAEEITTAVEETIVEVEEHLIPQVTVVPAIQLEIDDSPSKDIKLDDEIGAITEPQDISDVKSVEPESALLPRQSEVTKNEEVRDSIVSMNVEDGVAIVPMENPVPESRSLAKTKGKDADSLATTKAGQEIVTALEIGSVEAVSENVLEVPTTPVKQEVKQEVKAEIKVDLSSILTTRNTKNKKKRRNAGKNKVAAEAQSAPVMPAKGPVDNQTPPKRSKNRKVVVVDSLLLDARDELISGLKTINLKDQPPQPAEAESTPEVDITPAVEEKSDEPTELIPIALDLLNVFAEPTPVVEEAAPADVDVDVPAPAVEASPVPVQQIILDDKFDEELLEPSMRGKATLEEPDHEREHDGGVKLDLLLLEADSATATEPTTIETEKAAESTPEVVEVEAEPLPPVPVAVVVKIKEEEPEEVQLPVTLDVPTVATTEVVESVPEPQVPARTTPPVEPVDLAALPENTKVFMHLAELVEIIEPATEEEDANEGTVLEPRSVYETAVSIDSIVEALASCKDISALSKSLETLHKVAKPGTQEARLFEQLHQCAVSNGPASDDDRMSTRSKRSIKMFLRRGVDAYPQLLSSTTSRIKAILPPFLSLMPTHSVSTVNTPPPTPPTVPSEKLLARVKSQRPRFLPKVTMSLISHSWRGKSRASSVNGDMS